MENPTDDTPTTALTSPEFEFRHPSSHQPTLLSADQLFSGGVLLPLRLLTIDDPPDTPTDPIIINTPPITPATADTTTGSDTKTASKRWKHIFKKNPSETTKDPDKNNNKKKKKERTGASTSTGGVPAELNINLWPFSRSRSAGNGGGKPRTVAGNRKVSSAPCSRSNSTGDKHRKWPTSPGRTGVHLGRSSPVWQAKRFSQSRSLHDGHRPAKNSGAGANSNVPTCIGYRQRMSCQGDVGRENLTGSNDGVTAVGDGGASGLFGLRSLFTKKVLTL